MDRQKLIEEARLRAQGMGAIPSSSPINSNNSWAEYDRAFANQPVLSVTNKSRKDLTEKELSQRDLGNAASVIGGKEVSQGLGQVIANPKITKDLGQAQSQATDIQTHLLQRIKQGKDAGADTKRLEDALKVITENINTVGNETGQLVNQENLNAEKIYGSALQLATTVSGSKIAGGISSAIGTGTGVLAGVGRGIATGALSGAGVGALEGTAGAMKKGKDASDVGKSALLSGIGGVIAGGAIGAVTGGIAGKIKSNTIKKQDFVTDLVSPKQTADVKELAIKQGRATEPGIFNASKITPSSRDKDVASAVRDVVSPQKTVFQNTDAINEKIGEIDSGVKSYIKQNKVPFNTNQLRKKLNTGKSEFSVVFASDKGAQKTYDAVVKEFLRNTESKDTYGLLEARQSFDKIPAIKKLLDSQALGENVKKEIVLGVRRNANEYISELLPVGNKYKEQMLREHLMFDAIQNIVEKNGDIIGQNKLQILTKKNPILKWVIGGIAAGAVGAAGIGVGSSIIGSSD